MSGRAWRELSVSSACSFATSELSSCTASSSSTILTDGKSPVILRTNIRGWQSRCSGRSFGFTILELMIVVAILSIILSVAMPSLANARRSSNETLALGYLRSVRAAQTMYFARWRRYAESDEELISSGYMSGNSTLVGQNRISGYTFIVDSAGNTWEGRAMPTEPGVTGNLFFYVNSAGVLRFADGEPADENSAAID